MSWGIRLAADNADHLGADLGLSDDRIAELARTIDNVESAFWTLPLDQQEYMSTQTSPYFFDWLNHPVDDGFWSRIRIEDKHDDIQTPAYNLGGWYDIFLMGTLRNYVNMRKNGGSKEAGQWPEVNYRPVEPLDNRPEPGRRRRLQTPGHGGRCKPGIN